MAETKIANRHLKGTELSTIIQADVARMLAMDGQLNEYVGYGRVAYKIHIHLMMDNPSYPTHDINIASQTRKDTGIEAGPLKDASDKSIKSGRTRKRKIDNPNLERIKHKLPVPVAGVDTVTGRPVEQEIIYTPEQAGLTPELADPDGGAVDEELIEFTFGANNG